MSLAAAIQIMWVFQTLAAENQTSGHWDGTANPSEAVSHRVHVWSWFTFVSMRPRNPPPATTPACRCNTAVSLWETTCRISEPSPQLSPKDFGSWRRFQLLPLGDFTLKRWTPPIRLQSSTQYTWCYPHNIDLDEWIVVFFLSSGLWDDASLNCPPPPHWTIDDTLYPQCQFHVSNRHFFHCRVLPWLLIYSVFVWL